MKKILRKKLNNGKVRFSHIVKNQNLRIYIYRMITRVEHKNFFRKFERYAGSIYLSKEDIENILICLIKYDEVLKIKNKPKEKRNEAIKILSDYLKGNKWSIF